MEHEMEWEITLIKSSKTTKKASTIFNIQCLRLLKANGAKLQRSHRQTS